jgi:tetratricopeptide (TPR) repeat protein
MTFFNSIIVWLLSVFVAVAVQAAAPERFDLMVRADFFAGFAGDAARLQRAMEACEKTLAANPHHAEAMVWHGAGLLFQSGLAFQRQDAPAGVDLWTRGLKEMDEAVAIAPDNVGVLIPRGAVLLQASRRAPQDRARPLVEQAVADYERALTIQGSSFETLGDHPKGELLFGLAEGFSRLGRTDKARLYFDRLTKEAAGSGHTPAAQAWLETGALPASAPLGCVGCHQ